MSETSKEASTGATVTKAQYTAVVVIVVASAVGLGLLLAKVLGVY